MSWLVSTGLSNAAAATLLAVLIWAVTRIWKRPALAHLLWILVLVKLLSPPLFEVPIGWKLDASFLGLNTPAMEAESPRVAERVALHSARSNLRETIARPVAKIIESPASGSLSRTSFNLATFNLATLFTQSRVSLAAIFRWLPAVWVTGAILTSCLIVLRIWRFHRFTASAGRMDLDLSQRVRQLARQVKLATAPQIIVVQGVVSPMLWGLGPRIQIIFPAQLLHSLSPLSRDALLLHELAHYRRGDQWVRVIELATQILYWWLPLVWCAGREIEVTEEQCCDAWVVERQPGSRRSYAEALLATIDFLCDQPVLLPPGASGLGNVPLLKLRLTQIMCGDVAADLSRSVKLLVLVLALIILPLGPALLGASVRPQPSLPARASVTQGSSDLVRAEDTAEATLATPVADSTGTSPPATAEPTLLTVKTPITRPIPVPVTAVATSRNGKYRLERRKGSQVALVHQANNWRLDMSSYGILCAAFASDSHSFVTGHEDSSVRVWDCDTGGLTATLKGCTDAIWSLDVTSGATDSLRIAAGDKDGNVVVWDLTARDEIARLPRSRVGISCLRWSDDGDNLAISYGDFSDRDQATLLIWSFATDAMLAEMPLENPVSVVAWLPDHAGLLIADWTGDAHFLNLTDNSTPQRIWLGNDGKQLVEAAHWSADCTLVPVNFSIGRVNSGE